MPSTFSEQEINFDTNVISNFFKNTGWTAAVKGSSPHRYVEIFNANHTGVTIFEYYWCHFYIHTDGKSHGEIIKNTDSLTRYWAQLSDDNSVLYIHDNESSLNSNNGNRSLIVAEDINGKGWVMINNTYYDFYGGYSLNTTVTPLPSVPYVLSNAVTPMGVPFKGLYKVEFATAFTPNSSVIDINGVPYRLVSAADGQSVPSFAFRVAKP